MSLLGILGTIICVLVVLEMRPNFLLETMGYFAVLLLWFVSVLLLGIVNMLWKKWRDARRNRIF